jgi:hypothetical protein
VSEVGSQPQQGDQGFAIEGAQGLGERTGTGRRRLLGAGGCAGIRGLATDGRDAGAESGHQVSPSSFRKEWGVRRGAER